jgi:hypothetical protein
MTKGQKHGGSPLPSGSALPSGSPSGSASPLQQGGQIMNLYQELLNTIDSPIKLVYGVVVILLITYSSLIPSEYRTFADSVLGKLFGIGIIYAVTETMGWVYGLLTAMAFLLLLQGAARLQEGFDGGGTVSEKKTVGGKWFVEKVLGKPDVIATDHVMTSAIDSL